MKGVEIERDGNGRAIAATARWRDDGGAGRKKKFKGAGCVGQAQRHKVAMEQAKDAGNYVDITNRTTVAQYARSWVEARPYRDSSAAQQETRLTQHLDGTRLGKMRLTAVRHSDVQAWATERSKKLGPATVRSVLGFLRSVFAAATSDRLIGFNPATGEIMLPAAENDPIVPLTVVQVRTLSCGVPARMKALVITQAATGARAAELLAMRLEDVDFLRREWRIREQIHPRKRHRMPLKTPASRRDMPLPKVAIDALAAHLAEFPANSEGYIFTNNIGLPWQQQSYNDHVSDAAKNAKFAHTTTHDFRHHFASVLLDAGESVVAVAARLGHANADEVIRTYGHLMPDQEDRTRNAVDDAWCAPNVPQKEQKGL
jgi:integrase